MTTELYEIGCSQPGGIPWTEWLLPQEAANRAEELDAMCPECAPHILVLIDD